MKILIIISLLLTSVFSNEKIYNEIKVKLIKNKIPKTYVNDFFHLEEFSKFDLKSYKYFSPEYINKHKKSEKKANKNKIDKHLPRSMKHLEKYYETYYYTEKKYSVNKEIITSILLKETNIGKTPLKHNPIIVFNTLITKLKGNNKREKSLIKMSKDSLYYMVYYGYKNNYKINDLKKMKSSYAGAIGNPQFMPFNLMYAKSYENKIPDLSNMKDSIVSIANFSNKVLKFKKLIDWNKMPNIQKISNEWNDYNDKNEWISLSSKKHKNFMDILINNEEDKNLREKYEYFKQYSQKIYRYNNSSEYVIGIMLISYKLSKY